MPKNPFMTPDAYREAAATAGYDVLGIGRLLRIGQKTTYRYANGGARIPSATADLVRLLAAGKITEKQIEALRPKNGKRR